MAKPAMTSERRTSVDDVFEYLQTQIATLKLKPGDRLSEAEVASQFGISRNLGAMPSAGSLNLIYS